MEHMLNDITQIIPSPFCLKCDVCCRYPHSSSEFCPYFSTDEIKRLNSHDAFLAIGECKDSRPLPAQYKEHFICRFFSSDDNACKVYSARPLDCRLYPFMLTYDKGYESVVLAADAKCPYIKDKLDLKDVKAYVDYLKGVFEHEEAIEQIIANKNFIMDFQNDCVVLKRLDGLSKRLIPVEYGLRRLCLNDKETFDEYFAKVNFALSAFSFPGIYIWRSALNVLYKKINNALCVFAGNDKDYFLFLPPADNKLNKNALMESFEILSCLNKGGACVPRCENVPQEFESEFQSLGFNLKLSAKEYIYNRKGLAQLVGNKYKTKRAMVNKFTKKQAFKLRGIEEEDISACLQLARHWALKRLEKIKDEYYRLLMEDSYFAQKLALMKFKELGLFGKIVEVGSQIIACTIGYPLNRDTFAVLFETADLDYKGLSQFIFREFCRSLDGYRYINALSDSGLENLRQAKESYRPIRALPSFTAAAKA